MNNLAENWTPIELIAAEAFDERVTVLERHIALLLTEKAVGFYETKHKKLNDYDDKPKKKAHQWIYSLL